MAVVPMVKLPHLILQRLVAGKYPNAGQSAFMTAHQRTLHFVRKREIAHHVLSKATLFHPAISKEISRMCSAIVIPTGHWYVGAQIKELGMKYKIPEELTGNQFVSVSTTRCSL